MHKILEKRVDALKKKGMGESKAYDIATSSLQKEGKLKRGSNKLKQKT